MPISNSTRSRMREQSEMREKQMAQTANDMGTGKPAGLSAAKEPNQIDYMKQEVAVRDEYIGELEAEVLDLYRRIHAQDRPSRY